MEPLTPEQAFRAAVLRAADEALGQRPERVTIAYPPTVDLGDLATPLCFELARSARRPPRALAEAIVAAFVPGSGIARVEVAGGGYINAFLDRTAFLRQWLIAPPHVEAESGEKVIVEHTNINPNKAAHIGHLRNAVLGDTLVRALRRLGRHVEVQNYIDDTGVQVADLVVGFQRLRNEQLDEVRARYSEPQLAARGERFDYVAWDLYAEVTRHYAEDPARQAVREATLAAMEHGGNATADLAGYLAHRMVQHHLRTMARIGVRYDLLPHESDILRRQFWSDAFRLLTAAGAIHLSTEGRNAGCWVMQLAGASPGEGEDEKIIVRSNGTVTYVGKDMAYQLWKFGLLGRDFAYRRFDWAPFDPAYEIWTSCSSDGEREPPSFGHGVRVYNVIDTRQSYLQRVVTQGLRSLGHDEQAERSIHYAYEMVALTPAAVATLMPDHVLSDEDRQKPYLEMSGRRGLGVRADDLLDALVERALAEVRKRHPDATGDEATSIADAIAVAALRYYMLRFSRTRVVAFDFDAALAFEGETGPYLQYSVIRARNILGKLTQRLGEDAATAGELARHADFSHVDDAAGHVTWELPSGLSRITAVLEQSVESLELSQIAKHAYVLAQAFNSFYHRCPVVQEPDARVRTLRAAVVRLYHDRMLDLLDVLGIRVPSRM